MIPPRPVRDPQDYLFGDFVILPIFTARYLATRTDLKRVHQADRLNGRVDAALHESLISIYLLAAPPSDVSVTSSVTTFAPGLADPRTSIRAREWMGTAEAAERIGGISPHGVRRAIADGRLEAQRRGGRWRVSALALDRFCEQRRKRA